MRKQTEKREKAKNPPIYTFLKVFTVVFAVFTVIRVFAQQPTFNQQKIEEKELAQQIQNEKENIEHSENLKELYKTKEYQILVAKERLGYVEENEKVYKDANDR